MRGADIAQCPTAFDRQGKGLVEIQVSQVRDRCVVQSLYALRGFQPLHDHGDVLMITMPVLHKQIAEQWHEALVLVKPETEEQEHEVVDIICVAFCSRLAQSLQQISIVRQAGGKSLEELFFGYRLGGQIQYQGLLQFVELWERWLAGAVPVPLYPPVRLGRMDEYAAATGRMLAVSGARVVISRGGVMRLKTDSSPKARGVLDHEVAKPLVAKYPRCAGENHMKEWLDACKGGPKTFQPFEIAAQAAEFGMTGIVALRVGKVIDWDSQNLKAKGCPEADRWIHLPVRKKWLV